jgi:hypothetical protein
MNKIFGVVSAYLIYPGKAPILMGRGRNTVCVGYGDVVAKSLVGQMSINGMYMAFKNSGGYPTSVPPRERMASYYQTTGSTGDSGFCRVPLVQAPTFDSGEFGANHNILSVMAFSSQTQAVDSGSNDVTDATSQFYEMALTYQDPDNMANDIVVAAINLEASPDHAVLTKIAGAQIAFRWELTNAAPV